MKQLTAIISITIILLSFNALTFAEEYYVDASSGDNRNTGRSVEEPWKTISFALEYAVASQNDPAFINIAHGTYDRALGETFPLILLDNIRLNGADKETTIIDAIVSVESVISCNDVQNIEIKNVTITGGKGTYNSNSYYYGGGVLSAYSSLYIENCIVKGNSSDYGGGIYLEEGSVKISNCTIKENTGRFGAGLTLHESSATIEDCIIEYNYAEKVDGEEYPGGYAGGMLIRDNSMPSIINCSFINNSSDIYGGAIFCTEKSSPKFEECNVETNETVGSGGGFYFEYSSGEISDCIIKGNSSGWGGGILCYEADPKISGCTIEENVVFRTETTSGWGGGIYCLNDASPEITDCIIRANKAPCGGGIMSYTSSTLISSCLIENNLTEGSEQYAGTGGGILLYGDESSKILNCEIKNNKGNWGGGIYLEESSPHIKNCVLESNSVLRNGDILGLGGGIFCYENSDATIEKCFFLNNKTMMGGGIMCSGSSPVIDKCEFTGNDASDEEYDAPGGGIYCYENSSPTIKRCKFTENVSDFGGGISCYKSSSPSISDCIISGNIGFENGGGIFCQDDANAAITNCLITGNSSEDGGGIGSFDSLLKISFTTIDDNTGNLYAAVHNFGFIKPTLTGCIVWNNGQEPLAKKLNVTYSNVEGGYDGEGNIDQEPAFTTGPRGDYYLSCMAAGDDCSSPCIDAGNPEGIEGFNHKDYITRCDGVVDSGNVDMGFHYIPHINFGLGVSPVKFAYKVGDEITLNLDLETAPVDTTADVYLLLMTPEGKFLPGMTWSPGLKPLVSGITLPADLAIESSPLFTFTLPDTNPPVDDPGWYTFYITALKPGTVDFISNIASVAFQVK